MSREEETPSDPSKPDLSGLETPYLAALNEDWKSMESFYKKHPGRLLQPLAIDKDTAFHIAAYSAQTELLQQLLGLLEPSRILAALSYTNSNGNNTFHEVAITDKVEAAKLLISKLEWACKVDKALGNNPETKLNELLEIKNKLGETVLYRAAALGKIEVLKVFAERVPVGNLTRHFKRYDDVSILHIAVIGQHFVTGNWLLEKDNGSLGTQKGLNGMTCLQLLARMPSAFKSTSRMGKMERLLYDCLPASYHDEDNDSNGVEARTPSNQKKDLESGQATTTCRQFNKPLSVISRINYAIWIGVAKVISRIYCAIWIGVAKAWPAIDEIWKMKRKHTAALKITKSLVQMDTTWENSCGSSVSDKTISLGKADCLDDGVSKNIEEQGKEREGDQSNTTHEGGKGGGGAKKEPPCESNRTINYPLLFIAVSEGIVEIFDEILKVHPQAIEHVTWNEQNILHVAIRYRQKEIFRRVKKMKTIRDCRLASRIDNKGYTILHHVADYKGLENYDGVTNSYYGPAFQLQAELKWLENVRKIMPSHYVMHRNDYKKTADELFRESHAELLKKAQEWIKETAQSCSTVAVLVATVVFTAAYTVPGGNDNKGRPNFLHSPFFLFFTITDVVSLASSLTSVVMFLSILTSPFEQENFLRSLPRKLMVGFTFLFFSVTTTMLSFSATVLLIIRLENKTWTTTLIYSAAFLPVAVFALMQFPLYLSFTSSLHSILKRIVKKVPRFFKSALKARSPDT